MDNIEMQKQITILSLPELFRLRDSLRAMDRLITSQYVIDSLIAVNDEIEERAQ